MATDHLTCGETQISRIGLRRFSFPVLLMLLCVSASMTFAAADAMSQSADFDIAPQSMEPALHEWSRQSNVQVMVASHDVSGQRTDGVKGRLTAASALARLLQQTDLTYEPVGNNTVSVKRIAAAAAPTNANPEQTRSRGEEETREPASDKRSHRALEEVIVTAQKREERLQDVPISISVLGGDDLDRSTARGLTEALSSVPGVAVNEFSVGGAFQVPVRGVAADNVNFTASSPTAYYLDSVPFGFIRHAAGPDPNVYDLDRVEVLRGPQGTLYGASALNGVVRILTHDADLNQFEMKARGLTSNTDGGDWNYRGDLAINVPIVEDKLAARAVLGYQNLSGWIDKPNKNNANDAELSNARFKLNAEPTEQLSLGLSVWLSRSDYGAPSTGYDNAQHPSLIDEPISTDYDAYGLTVGYEFPWFSVASNTSYIDYANNFIRDLTPGGAAVRFSEFDFAAESFAEEVLLNSTNEGPWKWSLGAIYRDLKDRYFQFTEGVYLAPTRLTNTSESYAVFGELTRVFLDGRFALTGGLRYFEDDAAQNEQSRLTAVPPEQLINSVDKFTATTPRLVLSWNPSDQMTAYASYSEGFRSGMFQIPTVLQVIPFPPAEPDSLRNYEVGAKGTVFGGRLNFDAALYYIDWEDVIQRITTRVPVGNTGAFLDLGTLLNGDSASGVGFDFAMTAAPLDALELGVNFSWNDLTMDSEVISGGVVLFDAGDRLNNSTELTVGVSADYDFPLGGLQGRFSASANYTSAIETRTLFGGALRVTPSDSILISRVGVSIRAQDHWAGTLFVDNLNNERGSPARSFLDPSLDIRVRPRTIGAQLEYRF